MSLLAARSSTELMSGEVMGAITYVKRIDWYACTKTKAAKTHTPATIRKERRFSLQDWPT